MFSIQFQGLITHARVKDDDQIIREIATLFTADQPEHLARLAVLTNDLVSWTREPEGSSSTMSCWNLDGEITLDLPDGLPVRFLSGVPSLRELCPASRIPRREIGNRQPHPYFRAYVVLPQGSMYVGDWFEQKAYFGEQAGAQAVCVARTVVFTTDARNDVTFTLKTPQRTDRITVRANSAVLISNIEDDETKQDDHFVSYANFFEDKTDIAVPHQVAAKCEIVTNFTEVKGCGNPAHLSVECSNSTFP